MAKVLDNSQKNQVVLDLCSFLQILIWSNKGTACRAEQSVVQLK